MTADRRRLEGKRAVILTADEFEDMELFFPLFRLLEEGVEVTVAAPSKGAIQGEAGYSLEVDTTIDEIDPADFDLLIIPGGSPTGAPAVVRDVPKAREIATAFFAANKPVGSVCHGPYTLVSADLLKGRRLTSYWHDGVPEEIKAAGGIWLDEPVVVDGNLVTSRWPMDLPFFMREVMRLLRGDR
jgi:protease I